MSVKRIRKDCYEVRCRFRGNEVRRRFTDKWEAQEFEQLVTGRGMSPHAALREINPVAKADQREVPKYRDFVRDVWLPAKSTGDACPNGAPVSEATAYYCGNQIQIALDLIGQLKLDDLTKSHYLDVKRRLLTDPLNRRGKGKGRVYARASANKVLKRMKESLAYAEDIGAIERSPWSALRNIPLERKDKLHWRMPECRRFLETVKAHDHGHYTFFVMALNYGLRRSELFGLQLGDIDFEVGEILVQRQWDEYWYSSTGRHRNRELLKNGRPSKTLPITESVREALVAHTRLMVGGATQLFPFGAQIMKTPKKLIERYAKIAEVPVVSLHRMRDSFIANMSREGVNEAIIAAIAGCSKDNLKHYQQFDSRDARRALKVLDFG